MISRIKAVPYALPLQSFVRVFLVAAMLAVPMSTTAKSIFLGLALASIIISPDYRQDLLAVMSRSWCVFAVLLFLVAVVLSIGSPAGWGSKLWVIEKYSKLLYLPILAVGFRDGLTRRLSVHAFLIAMLITCICSVIKYFGFFGFVEDATTGAVFRNHIMTSFMMSFAAYLSGLLCFQQRHYKRVAYAALTLLFSFQLLFINGGRMGYIIYLLLMIMLMLQVFSGRQAIAAVLVVCSLFVFNYYKSPLMQDRITHAVSDWQRYKNNSKDTSIGFRLQFHQYAYDLFQRHPWLGNGTASFNYYNQLENPTPGFGHAVLEPHSQYWLVASEFGVFGCMALLAFFISLLLASMQLKKMSGVALAILVPFLIGNLSDSLLFYSGSGYFFIIFMALCLGEQVANRNEMSNAALFSAHKARSCEQGSKSQKIAEMFSSRNLECE